MNYLSFKIYWIIYSYVQSFSTMFDLQKFIHHIKMLSELNTLTLFRLDTCTIWFAIWIHFKHWEYLRYLLSNFFNSFNYQDLRDYCTQKEQRGCNVAIQNINIFPRINCFASYQKLLVWDERCTRENLKNLKPCRNLYVRNNDMVTLMVVSAQLDVRCVAGMYCWRWWCAGSSQGPGLGMEAMAWAQQTEDPLCSISTLLS